MWLEPKWELASVVLLKCEFEELELVAREPDIVELPKCECSMFETARFGATADDEPRELALSELDAPREFIADDVVELLCVTPGVIEGVVLRAFAVAVEFVEPRDAVAEFVVALRPM